MTSPATLSPIPPRPPSLPEPRRGGLGGPRAGGTIGSRLKAVRTLELMASGPTLLDSRDTSEGRSGRLPHAVRVPLSDIDQTLTKLCPGRQGVVRCASGRHSRAAVGHPCALGWDAASFSGSTGAWQRVGEEIR